MTSIRIVEAAFIDAAVAKLAREPDGGVVVGHFEARGEVRPEIARALFAAAGDERRFYWEHRAAGLALAARGRVLEVASEGAAVRGLLARIEEVDRSEGGTSKSAVPLLFGGFHFEPSQPGAACDWGPRPSLVLPELAIAVRDRTLFGFVARRILPAADPAIEVKALRRAEREFRELAHASVPQPRRRPALRSGAGRDREDYKARVSLALEAIRRGDVEKVVLGRYLEVRGPKAFDVPQLLAVLGEDHTAAVHFAIGEGEDVFLGATPEQLVSLEGDRVRSVALAGSARCCGDADSDARLGLALRESKKEQAEHAAVVREIRAVLEPLCGPLDCPEAPQLLVCHRIQHLQTPIEGRLRTDQGAVGVVDLARRLHPTPAVGGVPRPAALQLLAELEGCERGWYAGGVGYVGADAGGEFWVGLRSAQISGCSARVHAASGIVDGSDPAAEFEETEVKLAAMRAVLGIET